MSDPRSQNFNGSSSKNYVESSQLDSRLANLKVFEQAVVIDVLVDPSLRPTDPKEQEKIFNAYGFSIDEIIKEDYLRAPRNAIICKTLTDLKPYVCFPFFSSHFLLPVKPGENVWIYRQYVENGSSFRPYWLSRVPGELSTEDANYTWENRRFQNDYKNDKVDDESGNKANPRKLTFPSGNWKTWDSQTRPEEKTFLSIVTGSDTYNQLKISPVPRISKKPGDLVLQGSNNSSIVLGSLYGWDANTRPGKETKTSVASQKKEISATIDIVAGRGRFFSALADESKKSKEESPDNSTKPLVVENLLGFETDKNLNAIQEPSKALEKGSGRTNPQEGDPDYLLDASRIMISENADVDLILDTGANGTPKKFAGEVQNLAGATVAIKSDHIRIVARKTKLQKNKGKEPEDISDINGSIRIIKEGEKGAGDLATIIIEPDGTIHISGPRIFLGRAKGDGAENTDSLDGGQPYIRYKQLEKLWQDTMDALDSFCDTLTKHVTPGFGNPSPQITAAATKLKASISSNLKPSISKVKSQRIFGE